MNEDIVEWFKKMEELSMKSISIATCVKDEAWKQRALIERSNNEFIMSINELDRKVDDLKKKIEERR